MDVRVSREIAELSAETALIVLVFDGAGPSSRAVDALGADQVALLEQTGRFPSSRYKTTMVHSDGHHPAVLYISGGEGAGLENIIVMRLAAAAARTALSERYSRLAFLDPELIDAFDFGHAVTEGAIRGAYDPALKKSKREQTTQLLELVLISSRDGAAVQQGADLGRIVGEANTLARDLINLPPNDLTPTVFAERAEQLAGECGLRCDVLEEQAMRDLGMGAILGVAAGSAEPPRLIVLHYGSDDAPTKLSLVGKGLTFDSGGLSLKTAEGMETMKHDMGGGGAVVAGMVAIAHLKPANIQVTAYVGATENMPGGKAMRPGDVLTALNGETIEVLNTDAEGRLVLADLLAYAKQQGATHVVDFATLTGGAVVALGTACSLAAGHSNSWVASVVEAAERGLERAWRMPLFEEYRQAMDSEVADIKNSGGRQASPLTASAFLSDFAEGMEWAHIDIAGTSWSDRGSAYQAKGATGEGVGTIVSLVRWMSESQ